MDSISLVMESQLRLVESSIGSYKGIIKSQKNIIESYKQKESLSGAQNEVREEELAVWKKRYRKQKKQKILVAGIALGLITLMAVAN